jgi:hypothetical protein
LFEGDGQQREGIVVPEIETGLCTAEIRNELEQVRYEPRSLTALMAVSLALLAGSPESSLQQHETLASADNGSFVPVFAILTATVWLGALEAIRRFTS